MALVLIPNPPTALTLSSHWTDFVSREDKSNVGTGIEMSIFRLTNWDVGTAKPLVEQGSIIEVGGSIYQADSDTALTDDTGLVDGLCFIKLVPGAGSPDPTTVTPTLTSDAMPSWDAEKGGWYDSDDKFLPLLMTRSGSGSSFINKGEYVDQNKRVIQYIDGGTYFAGGAEIGGSLSVGSGATFGGAVTGITDLTASGSLFFESGFRTRVLTLSFDTDQASYSTVYTAPSFAFAMCAFDGISPAGEGFTEDQFTTLTLHDTSNAEGGTTGADVELYRYTFSPTQSNILYCRADGNELQFRFKRDVGTFVASVKVLVFEAV